MIILSYSVLFIVLLFLSGISANNAPKADKGMLDLSRWNFAQSGNIELNGEWTFYRNQLLTPKDIQSGQGRQAVLTDVPLNNITNPGGRQPGSGTYRLIIRSNQDHRIFAIKVPVIYTASKVYVNGKAFG